MRAYRAELTAELHRLDCALAALGIPTEDRLPSAGDDRPGDVEAGTFDLLREFIRERPQVDAPAALEYLLMRGWNTAARNRLNAVRTALAHLASWGELERVERGIYRSSVSPVCPIGTTT